jgi:hypothetical protein
MISNTHDNSQKAHDQGRQKKLFQLIRCFRGKNCVALG